MDIHEYFKRVHKKAAELDPETEKAWQADPTEKWIPMFRRSEKSIALMNNRNEERDYVGCLTLTNPFVAAELLLAGTHRLATPEEIRANDEEMARRREAIVAEDQARQTKGTSVSITPVALRAAIAGLGIPVEEKPTEQEKLPGVGR